MRWLVRSLLLFRFLIVGDSESQIFKGSSRTCRLNGFIMFTIFSCLFHQIVGSIVFDGCTARRLVLDLVAYWTSSRRKNDTSVCYFALGSRTQLHQTILFCYSGRILLGPILTATNIINRRVAPEVLEMATSTLPVVSIYTSTMLVDTLATNAPVASLLYGSYVINRRY